VVQLFVREERARYSGAGAQAGEEFEMSLQMVLLPVFVLVGFTFGLLVWMAGERRRALIGGEAKVRDIVLGQPNWPTRTTQIGNCYSNQFELPLLFYILIALALPLHHADLFIVLMSWVFVVARFAHAGIFVTSNDLRQRSLAWFAGALVLFAMWLYFALKILLLI
jgi:hypothetical protein